MTKLFAQDQTDFDSYDLNFWYANLDFEEFNDDANEDGWEDNYFIYTTTNDALGLYGFGFAEDLGGDLTIGTIEALSQWAWVPDDSLVDGGYWEERWHWSDWDNIPMDDFWQAGNTAGTGDDFKLIKTILDGDDILQLSEFDDAVRGFRGDDVINGNGGDDVINGNKGDDLIRGGQGDDLLKGDRGHDFLDGRRGMDTVNGGNGYDTVTGGEGNDVLRGGGKEDTFLFQDDDAHDVIKDFDAKGAKHDVLDLSELSQITSFADLMLNHLTASGGDIVINAGGGDIITLENVGLGSLDSGDFIF
ncbi:MAG: hypothetical protein KDK53_04070 [Maritimibacter sp.]|nr:hypothetical protein [Maritimibacter sp.]